MSLQPFSGCKTNELVIGLEYDLNADLKKIEEIAATADRGDQVAGAGGFTKTFFAYWSKGQNTETSLKKLLKFGFAPIARVATHSSYTGGGYTYNCRLKKTGREGILLMYPPPPKDEQIKI